MKRDDEVIVALCKIFNNFYVVFAEQYIWIVIYVYWYFHAIYMLYAVTPHKQNR